MVSARISSPATSSSTTVPGPCDASGVMARRGASRSRYTPGGTATVAPGSAAAINAAIEPGCGGAAAGVCDP
ncbi:MAG TPA: hypothetical protein VGX23_17100 [Actinocrinis sp.]|nr:hypothetical protein [Actinocrinis sp.]